MESVCSGGSPYSTASMDGAPTSVRAVSSCLGDGCFLSRRLSEVAVRIVLLVTEWSVITAGFVLAITVFTASPVVADSALVTSLPSLGMSVDVQKEAFTYAKKGVMTQDLGYLFRFATQRYDDSGGIQDLEFNQDVLIQSIPYSVSYGLTDSLSLGFSLPVVTYIRQHLSLTNFAPGTEIAGIDLPVGQRIEIDRTGSENGDLTLNAQYRFDNENESLKWHLLLDARLPIARNSPKNASDIPVGQGNYSLTPSVQVVCDADPLTYQLRLGYEYNFTGCIRVLDDETSRHSSMSFTPGNGVDLVAGARLQANDHVVCRALLLGSIREARVQGGLLVSNSSSVNVELRPGIDFSSRGSRFSIELLVPITGKNTLRSTGAFFNYGYSL